MGVDEQGMRVGTVAIYKLGILGGQHPVTDIP